jgi:hypothetical protein
MKDFMKKIHLLATMKLCLLFSAGMLMAACDDTYDGKDRYESSVKNATLESPTEITITQSSDGSSMTIEWPVVYGAGGYEFKLINANGGEELVSKTIDGCKVTASCEEDMLYRISVRTLGNTNLNNTEAATALVKEYSTFTETYAKIEPCDLYEYFQNNPISEDATEELNFDLMPGGQYTLSQPLNLNFKKVVLRSSDKANHANIAIAKDAYFELTNDFSLKYINLDCSQTETPILMMYKYADEAEVAPYLEKPKNYYLINFLRLIGCDFRSVIGSLYYDNNLAYAVVNFVVKNTLIEMNTTTDKVKFESFISCQGGGVKDFSIVNSTVYQKGTGNSKYFLRYNNSCRVDRLGWTTSDHTTLTYTNCTFYKVASGLWANYSGISNYSIYDLQNNIWYDCADGQIARRMMGNGRLGNNCSFNSVNNTYWHNGAPADQGNYDTSNTQLQTDPAFEAPEADDFTPTGAQQVEYRTGDTRWYE